jgi:hypothetical protein
LKPGNFVLQADACVKETSSAAFADPATDFRVFGINVFKEFICAKYQPQM